MRLFSFLLATALVAALKAQLLREELGVSYKLPNGLPDGAVLIFFMRHTDMSLFDKGTEPINIDFYDKPIVTSRTQFNVNANIQMEFDTYYPIKSNTYINGKWQTEVTREQPMDTNGPHMRGYWRVDVIKIDSRSLNVYCEGFWSDVRTFDLSLNKLRSVYVISQYIEPEYVFIRLKLPNSNIAPLNFAQFKDWIDVTRSDFGVDRKLISFPNFPIGAKIEMTVLLKASAEYKEKTPTLLFKTAGDSPYFMRIMQYWGTIPNLFLQKTHKLFLTYDDENWGYADHCSGSRETRPNGDLVHLILRRIGEDVVKLRLLYKSLDGFDPYHASTSLNCDYVLPWDKATQMDKPFDIVSHDGALIFHLEHTIPMNATMN